jgi:tRNA uridine 5-carbamoylmethylation protein Kti12
MSEVEQELHSATASSPDRLVIVDDNMYYRYRRTALSPYYMAFDGNWAVLRCPFGSSQTNLMSDLAALLTKLRHD